MTEKAQQKNRGWYDMQQPMSKTQPAKASDPSQGGMQGDKNTEHRDPNNAAHTFNYKGKVTHQGSNYQEFGKPQAGLGFNGQDKDASIAYLKERGMKGQEVRNFSGGVLHSKLRTENAGPTIYNNMPIKETYDRATGGKIPSGNAVIRPQIEKAESNTPGNEFQLGKQIRDKKK